MVRWLSLRCSASQRWGFRPLGSSAWGKSLPTSSTEVSGGTQLPGIAFPTGSQVRGTERKDEGRRAETVSQFVIAPTACSHRRPQAREPSWRSWRCLVCQAVLPPFASCPCGSCPDTASSGFRFQFQVEIHVLSLSAVVGAGRTPPGVGSMSTWRDGL